MVFMDVPSMLLRALIFAATSFMGWSKGIENSSKNFVNMVNFSSNSMSFVSASLATLELNTSKTLIMLRLFAAPVVSFIILVNGAFIGIEKAALAIVTIIFEKPFRYEDF